MMIARTTNTDGEWLLLGLSAENVRRLKAGEPIRIHRNTHGNGVPEGWTLMIIYGATELEMKRELEAQGLIGPETKINVHPRLE